MVRLRLGELQRVQPDAHRDVTFTGVTIGTPACPGACTTVSSSVTIPSTLTCPTNASLTICPGAPLYLGLIQLDPNSGNPVGIYVTEIANPQVGVNNFPSPGITVPNGSNYAVIGILDQLDNGGFGVGTVSNTNNLNSGNLTISSSTPTVPGIALPTTNSVAAVATQYNSYTCSGCGGTQAYYQLNFDVAASNRLPVAVTLASGPNVINSAGTVAVDMSNSGCQGCGSSDFRYSALLPGGAPNIGDTYGFTVKYSDGTSENGTVVNGAVTAFGSTGAVVGPSDLPTNLSPAVTSGSDTPTFTWTDPTLTNASSYFYSFYLDQQNGTCPSSGCQIWQIPGNNSNSSGFSNSITSIPWNTDPTGGGSLPSANPLTSGTTYNWTIQINDNTNQDGNQANSAQSSVSFVAPAGALMLPAVSSNPLGQGVAGYGYGQTINASGGAGGNNYSFVVNGTTIPENGTATTVSGGDGLTFSSNGNHTLTVSGTPTTAESVSLQIEVIDTANTSNNATVTYSVPISSVPSGSNNSYLKGTYVCKFDGFNDSDNSRGAVLLSMVANGSGSLTSGIFDENDRDLSTSLGGTITGNYSIGADNNGLLTVTTVVTSGGTGSNTSQFAVALNNLAGPTASEFRLVESDDVGSNASGEHGSADCYLATPSAFNFSTMSGNSFAYGLQGEDAGGLPEAWAGRFTASAETSNGGTGGVAGGSITNGIYDGMYIKKTFDGGNVFTGSYTAPNSTTGRFTIAMTQTVSNIQFTENWVGYIIDADRMFLLETAGDGGMQDGDMRTQLNMSTYNAADLSGSFVTYEQGYEYSSSSENVTGYDSILMQASGAGTGSFTVNSSYQDENGTYQDGQANGATATVTFDPSNPGRASTAVAGSTDTMYAYYFNTGSAFQLDFNGSQGYLATGWTEPQTQTTFNDATAAGNYMFGRLPAPSPAEQDRSGQYDLSSAGAIGGGFSTGWKGIFTYDQTPSYTYAFDSTVTGTGSLLWNSPASCVVINSTRMVCTTQANNPPFLFVLQQ